MKKTLIMAIVLLFVASLAQAVDVGFQLNISGGKTLQPAPQPGFVIAEPPVFLMPATLGFQVAVGIPYDMFLISGRYYAFHDNVWYAGPSYNGPWGVVKYKNLPPGLQKHRVENMRAFRDEEYRSYKAKNEHGEGNGHGRGKEKHRGKGRGWKD